MRRPSIKKKLPFQDVEIKLPESCKRIHPYNYKAYLSTTPDMVASMGRLDRIVYNKHKVVYDEH